MQDGKVVASQRELLPVKEGERGIRQSDAVFIHLKKLPQLFHELIEQIDRNNVQAVGVSTRPRNVEGSYMPVFVAGDSVSKVLADSFGARRYEFSHQDGHIMAGILSTERGELLKKPFLAVHLSGGTTEILRTEYTGTGFRQDIIGGTSDLSAGQFIDRVGVSLGLPFPCGKKLEEMAQVAQDTYPFPVSVKGTQISFSGVETKAQRILSEEKPEAIALGVFMCVAKSLKRALNSAAKGTGCSDILFVGGVASNALIRQYLTKNLSQSCHFAQPEYATDNACGIAALAERTFIWNQRLQP